MNEKPHAAMLGPEFRSLRHSAGFSLFELVVFIISVAIIYASAARRFADFPGEAERANFYAVTTQIQAGINLEMMLGITQGRAGNLSYYENANPMDLLLDPPSNYLGAFELVDKSRVNRRSWYFDLRNKELVYLINDAEGVFYVTNGAFIPTDEIRFQVKLRYRYTDALSGLPLEILGDREVALDDGSTKRSVSGILMEPAFPFEWGADRVILDPAEIASN